MKACSFLTTTKHGNDIRGEVMACEDVQIMWSMLHHHNTKPRLFMPCES
ncbi:hypothetical protein AMTRI_Chr01g104300 [Amborella trichopoda]